MEIIAWLLVAVVVGALLFIAGNFWGTSTLSRELNKAARRTAELQAERDAYLLEDAESDPELERLHGRLADAERLVVEQGIRIVDLGNELNAARGITPDAPAVPQRRPRRTIATRRA